ncbi:pyroglutamyl-peptidase I [Rothia sp. LK2588]|uniref:pyroglutamyl-peptidase I family protein n=1 Tax=Rothia sp. LK2588 TaxID=3114369 RepID=UPI0034CE323B
MIDQQKQLTVLLTYFGAFEGVPLNPSQAVVDEATRLLYSSAPHLRIETRELPVTFAGSGKALAVALDETRPVLAISCGVAVGRDSVSLERVAINLDDARIADNDGFQPTDAPITEDAPAAYFSTLPTRASWQAAVAENLPVSLSYSAGTYVCNHVFYSLMSLVGPDVPAGFVHVPAITELHPDHMQAETTAGGVPHPATEKMPSVALAEAARVLELVVLTTLAELESSEH